MSPIEIINMRQFFRNNDEYAWSWYEQLLSIALDSDATASKAKLCAARFMQEMLDYDITSHPKYKEL
jgi:hypothetical protein